MPLIATPREPLLLVFEVALAGAVMGVGVIAESRTGCASAASVQGMIVEQTALNKPAKMNFVFMANRAPRNDIYLLVPTTTP
jgi:hypothetical protein